MSKVKAGPISADRLKERSRLVESGCIEWTARLQRGYGMISFRGINRPAHRIAWMLANGPIPTGMHVCHRCDNRRCINVAHLFLGTNADNMADKVGKNRQARGSRHGSAKLTEQEVRDIRAMSAPQRAIAAFYGMSQSTVSEIKRGELWSHI